MPKTENKFRFYIDYKGLNKIIYKNRITLFLITEILDRFFKAIVIIKFNLKNTYYRLRIVKSYK